MRVVASLVALVYAIACFASVSLAAPSLGKEVFSRAVPPAGSDTFNPGTLSHPLLPVANIASSIVQDETGTNSHSH
ncbi:hypothetical protein PHLGIDRAFT_272401 [Phlebiopsis gigantea 11061_1 CR5-6]|uniref:Uncharacterized protein n=1 Tax=Phlebiopsis gigantea (strain 11061_1 CR5-6) TaxID=745531 RepID=A0A0C3S3F7_PHLG1|nr:hypothetical protein PHLGIDRAFT_272401 [Phlebiopsis gigantea 11061_1 CR5-6]